MKKSKKILITVAVILVAVGMICGFCGIYSLGFNFNEISTSDFVLILLKTILQIL